MKAYVSWLREPRAQRWLFAVALLLAAPTLFQRLLLDDYVLALLARGGLAVPGFEAHPLFLFRFTSGRPVDNHALMDLGALLPWWSDEHHLNSFFRPLSSLTHLLDFKLWPDSPWLMHVHSLLWFLALLLAVRYLYRSLASSDLAVTTLAFGLFALDGSHGMTIGWIANRNALCSAAMALISLPLHHRFLTRGFRAGAYLAPACFALGLCAGETALAVLGYLLAYTLVLDRAPLLRRGLHLLPYLALVVAWRIMFIRLGLGSAGSGGYHDPGREPLGYAWALLTHVPVLLSAQLGVPLVDAWFWGAPELHALIWIVSAATLLLLLWVGHLLLARDNEARFWMLGMLLSTAAVSASVPGERLLLVPGVGAAVFVAKLIWALLPRSLTAEGTDKEHPPIAKAAWATPLLWALVFLHLVVAPLRLPLWAWSLDMFAAAIERVDRSIPATPEIAQRSVFVVNAPFDLMVSYIQVRRAVLGMPRPSHLNWLATASSALSVQTRDARTLRIRPARGFMLTPPERHYRGDTSTLAVGAEIALSEVTVRVLEVTADQRPAAAEFRFREPMRSSRYLMRKYEHGRLVPFIPPAPGQSVELPRLDFFLAVLSERLGFIR